ncbi:MAG TPA: hypothetical protein VGH98_10230 [Gemmatimonadaceae bacterium]|jgi:hypothetical protein
MDDQLQREIRRLRRTNAVAVGLLVIVSVSAFVQARPARTKFDEIDIERINVREPDGTLRLTISNHARLPEVVVGGKSYPLRGGTGVNSAGLIFFNDEGNEDGGLVWAGSKNAGGYQASAALTFDQFDQDETISLEYGDENRRRQAGLAVLDRPDEPIQIFAESAMAIRAMPDGPAKQERARRLQESAIARGAVPAQRLFAGKRPDKSSMVILSDRKGQPRLRLSVDSLGTARIEFLDDSGHVTRSLTGSDAR